MSKPPAFQLYAADFDMDTATWENDEVGAYLRLLLYEWVNGGLPDDTFKLSKIVRESQKKFIGKWKNLSTKFIRNGNGLLINKRMEEVREQQSQYIESQREKGKKSAKKRWEGHITPVKTMVTDRLQPEDNSSSSTSSSTSNKEKKYIKKRVLSDEEWTTQIRELYSWVNWNDLNREIDAWLLIHPNRKKTRNLITTFLSNKQKDKPMLLPKQEPSPIQPVGVPNAITNMLKEATKKGWKV